MSRKTILPVLFSLVLLAVVCATAVPARADTDRVSPGETVTGRLERDDDQLEDECYFDTWTIEADPGTLLRITESSDEMDSYLIVTGPHDLQWENDDYAPESGLDSRVMVLVNERRGYEILATSFSSETGRYELTVEEVPPPVYYGVFVGIEEYGEEIGDAPLCDQDAEDMYDAFVRSGLMERDNGIVLTNRHAEKPEIEDAFAQLNSRMTVDDVFVFFFSGHGNQVEVSGRTSDGELDGLDEAISLVDGDLIDDDFAGMLDGIKADLIVVVLDSCNSGGIARDIVHKPGIVCFASSEEDVLSDFAPELEAGGYLSVFFREAIAGDGDLDGDGMILVGELVRFLLGRYYQEGPTPTSSSYGYQELVHDRGLVKQDTVFCWWNRPGETGPAKP